MIFLNPLSVKLGAFTLTNVTHIAIDRAARRTAEEWTDLGAFASFADVPEQRAAITIARRITETETTAPKPGDSLTLSFRAAPSASAAQNRAVSATIVITAVEHAISSRGIATQQLRAVAVSATGAADPITETAVEGEA